MKLNKLLSGVNINKIMLNNKSIFKKDCTFNVEYLHINSKQVKKNSLFFALCGFSLNGQDFIKEAVLNGASVVVCEEVTKYVQNVVYVIVNDVRKTMATVAANFFGRPHKKIKIIGITGTCGKSSSSYIMHQLLSKLNFQNNKDSANNKLQNINISCKPRVNDTISQNQDCNNHILDNEIKSQQDDLNKIKCGYIGTNAIFIGDKKMRPSLTTPDPIELFDLLNQMVKEKCEFCVMEISAHAIYLNKIYGIEFEALCLTNISQDHLDFFKDIKTYSKTKESLFYNFKSKNIILNLDDKIGRKILKTLVKNKANNNLYGFSSKENFAKKISKKYNIKTLYFRQILMSLTKTLFNVQPYNFLNKCSINNRLIKGKLSFALQTNLVGKYNLQNICISLCVLDSLGIDFFEIKHFLNNLNIEGRFNVYNYNNKINFILDYAHTPQSTRCFLSCVKKVSKALNIIVIGCPGNRDELKRKITGKIISKADYIVLTSDNPKYENPNKIIRQIYEGVTKNKKNDTYLIEDRLYAIKFALSLAVKLNQKVNILLVGKGVENYQDYNNIHISYSDLEQIMLYTNKKAD